MEPLVRALIPHAPRFGLHVAPEIPADKLRAAIKDYAPEVAPASVLALYDATRMGSAKDGALFLADRFVFQNTDFQPPLTVRYDDLIQVEEKRSLLGARRVTFDLNRGRATVTEILDFAAQPDAAPYVARFLKEAVVQSAHRAADARTAVPETNEVTDERAVRAALEGLRDAGQLAAEDHERLLRALRDA